MNVLFCPCTALQVEPASSLTKMFVVPILATPTKVLLEPLEVDDVESKVIHPIPMISDP
jgi:hypothetical protein